MNHNILIICSTNTDYMPYLKNYTKILDEREIEYDLLVWNRMHLEETNSAYEFKDEKKSVRRNFLDYYKFYVFIKSVLKQSKYEKIIIFGIQMMFFCQRLLIEYYAQRYLFDIRDYHILARVTDLKRVIRNAKFTVISSPGYRCFLPSGFDYIVNHNSNIVAEDLFCRTAIDFGSKYITYMGALRDLEINKKLIVSLADSYYEAYFAGESDYTKELKDFVKEGRYNVKFTGRYKKEEEKDIYEQTLLVNVLRYADSLNNKIALPNRLYNAPLYMKPLLSYKGTYLSDLTKKYKLGLVLNDFSNLNESIEEYIKMFDFKVYLEGRNCFLKKVIEDNLVFKQALLEFCKNS